MALGNQAKKEIRQQWDKEADTFDNEPDHGLRDPVVLKAWRKLLNDSLPPAPTTILDVGCGTGSLSLVLAAAGHDVSGIDLSPVMIARASAKAEAAGHLIPFKVMDASNPKLPPNSFDVILCRHLLWSLPEPALSLQRWSTLLVPGGRLLLIEGYWHTGAGLHAHQVVEALPAAFSEVVVRNLSVQPDLWGGEVNDERFIVTAALSID